MTRTTFKSQRATIQPWRDPPPPGWRLVPDHPTEAWIAEMRRHSSYPATGQAIELMLRCAPTYGADQ